MLNPSNEFELFDNDTVELPVFDNIEIVKPYPIESPNLSNVMPIERVHTDLSAYNKLPQFDYEIWPSEFEDPYEIEEDPFCSKYKYQYQAFDHDEEQAIVDFIHRTHGRSAARTESINDQFEQLIRAQEKAARVADENFLKHLCNIQNYEFHPMKLKPKCIIYKNWEKAEFRVLKLQIKAVIDFMKLEFTSNVSTTRIKVKEILTKKTGTKFYTEADESNIEMDGQKFSIILHDIKERKQLKTIIDILIKHFKANVSELRIKAIELSIDFYNAQNNALLIALFKSLRLSMDTENIRIYKNQKATFTPVIQDPYLLLKHIDDDWCIGINHRESPLFFRLYHKTTDRNRILDKVQHRHRVEVNLNGVALENVDCHPYNLSNLIKYGFRKIQFTLPSFENNIADKAEYENNVKPFGMETTVYSQTNHRTRSLAPYLKPHTDLNRLIRKAVDNLSRKF